MMCFTRVAPSLPLLRRYRHCILHHIGKRTLLSDADLKIDHFMRRRILKMDLLKDEGKASLFEKLVSISDPAVARSSTYDLVDLLFIADKEDLSHVKKAFKTLSLAFQQKYSSDMGVFHYGSTLLRLYHHLEVPDEAYTTFYDPELAHVFNDDTCYKLIINLMYQNRQYDRVLDVFSRISTENMDCITIMLGACYHLNTIDSFEKSQVVVKTLSQYRGLSVRATSFAAFLALNQDKPATALDMLMHFTKNNLILNVKLTCLARLGDLKSVVGILEHSLQKAETTIEHPLSLRIYSDTISDIRKAIKSSKDISYDRLLHRLEQELAMHGVLSVQVTTSFLDRIIPGSSYFRASTTSGIENHSRR